MAKFIIEDQIIFRKIKQAFNWLMDRKTLIIIILIVLLFLSWKGNQSTKHEQQDLIETLSQRDSILGEKITELDGKLVKSYELAAKTFRESQLDVLTKVDERYAKLEKRLKTTLKKPIEDLSSSIEFTSGVKDTVFSNRVEYINSAPEYGQYLYEDDTILLASDVIDSTRIKHIYEIKPTKFYVDIFADQKLFKPVQMSAFVSTENPKYQIDHSNVFVRSTPKPSWAVTVGGGIGFDLINLRPIPTVGIFIGKPIKIVYR